MHAKLAFSSLAFASALTLTSPCLASVHNATLNSNAYGKVPMQFEANHGQASPDINFLARGQGYGLALASNAAVFTLNHSAPVTLRLNHSNSHAQSSGEQTLPGKVNYFIGRDPQKWRTNIPTYARVRYHDVYPGTDLVYYGNQQQMEYDFVLRPHADAQTIQFVVTGARKMRVAQNGDLELMLSGQKLVWRKPVIYQGEGAARRSVSGRYALLPGNRVGFTVGNYDHRKTLVIDPVLAYSTYLETHYQDSQDGLAIAVDSQGCAYLTGSALPPGRSAPSPDHPLNNNDVFVTKLNAAGTSAVYTTYLGGNYVDDSVDVKVDSSGDAFIAGFTSSYDFPLTPGAYCSTYSGGEKPFIFKLNPAGNQLVYSTLIANSTGAVNGLTSALAIDAYGNAYITGYTGTYGGDFPTTDNAFQRTNNGNFDAFLSVVNSAGSGLIYSSLIGGPENDFGRSIAVTADGHVFVAGISDGYSAPGEFPTTPNAFQRTHLGSSSAFVCKFDLLKSGVSSLVYSTLLSIPPINNAQMQSVGEVGGVALAVNSVGEAYIAGSAEPGLPVTTSAYQSTGVSLDAFLTKFSADGSKLLYSTYLTGNIFQNVDSLALQDDNIVYVAGWTAGANSSPPKFPITPGAYQINYGGGDDNGFLSKIDTSKSGKASLLYSTYFGGPATDTLNAIALDSNGDVYMAGLTQGSVPVTSGAFHTTHRFGTADQWDLWAEFVAKLNIGNIHGPATLASLSPSRVNPGAVGAQITVTGTNFAPGAAVMVNDSYSATTSVISATKLIATLPAAVTSTTGSYFVRVINPGYNAFSNTLPLSVAAASPVITSLNADRIPAGLPSFTLFVNGNGIVAGSKVSFNGGAPIAPTVVRAPYQVAVAVPAELLANPGAIQVRIVNSFGDGGTSAPKALTVAARPVITSIMPTSIKAGTSPAPVIVSGAGFESGAVLSINNSIMVTPTVVWEGQIRALLPDSVSAAPGVYSVRVVNPGLNITSNPINLTVTAK